MDFRMDKSSWFMIVFMIATMSFFIVSGSLSVLGFSDYAQATMYGIIATLVLVALACIPVLIYCFFIKMIPDIDYSIRAAFVITLIGIISEVI
jgi:hypothetical protein